MKHSLLGILFVILIYNSQSGHAQETVWGPTSVTRNYGKPTDKSYFYFSSDIKFQVINEHTLKISGVISKCRFEKHSYAWRKYRKYNKDAYGKPNYNHPKPGEKWQIESDNYRSNWDEFIPEYFMIKNPVGGNVRCDVSQTGHFTAVINSSDNYYFKRPTSAPSEYHSIFVYKQPLKAILTTSTTLVNLDGKEYSHELSYEVDLDVKFLDLDKEKIKKKVIDIIGQTATVRIGAYNIDTRVPLSVDWNVTGTNISSQNVLKEKWLKYCTNKEVAEMGLNYIPNNYIKNYAIKRKGNSINFTGLIGGTYKIETRNAEYYYFSDLLTPDEAPTTDRTVLLVKVGTKINNSSESQQGKMIKE